jgi:hypothetical protein
MFRCQRGGLRGTAALPRSAHLRRCACSPPAVCTSCLGDRRCYSARSACVASLWSSAFLMTSATRRAGQTEGPKTATTRRSLAGGHEAALSKNIRQNATVAASGAALRVFRLVDGIDGRRSLRERNITSCFVADLVSKSSSRPRKYARVRYDVAAVLADHLDAGPHEPREHLETAARVA